MTSGQANDKGKDPLVFRRLDTEREEPATEVAEIVAELRDADMEDLPPIYGTIDHLLTHLFENPPSADAQAKVEFHYAGYQITVHQHGGSTFLKLD